MNKFQGVIPAIGQALTDRGYIDLTEVQNAVLLPELKDADLLVSAQTGSGKTVAFGLSLAPTLLGAEQTFGRAPKPLALVIAPTRELAMQVTRELEWLYQPCNGLVASCVGGMDIRRERDVLARGPHIVVGTPGRLRDHIERGYLDPSELKAVVLDEADEMLDMGFHDELQYILETAPKERRTLLFSATVPNSIAALAKRYQRDARRITTKDEKKQHVDIEYQAFTVAPSDRENAIINLLRYHDAQNAIIFCSTRAAVNLLTSRLTNRGFSVVALSGELSQNERTHALQALRDGRAQVCVATDVASRGIDLPGLALVIHADIPKKSDVLLHRSGRTGRAGSKGVSVLIVPHNARFRTERLLQEAKVVASWGALPTIEAITQRDHERFMTHPALHDAISPEEQPAIDELLARFTPAQVAAALLRVHSSKKPAPEETLDQAPMQRPRPEREAFNNSVWISVSAGRNVNAEARWILPMLCGAGNITKNNIGAIKIQQTETFVELTADSAEGFFEAIGPKGTLENDIVVKRLEGVPSTARDEGARPSRSFDTSKKPYRDGGNRSSSGAKRSFGDTKKPYRDDGKPARRLDSDSKRSFDDKKKPYREDSKPAGRSDSGFKRSFDDTKKPYRDDKKAERRSELSDRPAFKDTLKPYKEGKSPERSESNFKRPYDDKKKPFRDDGKPAFKDKPKSYKDNKPSERAEGKAKPSFKKKSEQGRSYPAKSEGAANPKMSFKKKPNADGSKPFKSAGKAKGKPTKITLIKPKSKT